MQEVVKCVKQDLPLARIARFKYDDMAKAVRDRNLKFLEVLQDPERSKNEDGYYALGPGDSGSGYMVTDGTGSDERYTFLALVYKFVEVHPTVTSARGSYDTTGECRELATKLTKDIIDWFNGYVERYTN